MHPTRAHCLAAVLLATSAAAAQDGWKPVPGSLMTRWAADVKPDSVLTEYPRPQMVRRDWLNLNGLWNYAIHPAKAGRPGRFDGQILVPFPIESALSGVMKCADENQRLWYRRTFEVPAAWRDRRLLLHFGAVDWETTVFVNGREIGVHRGGYDPFSFDITDALNAAGKQELVVAVFDPTDTGAQPTGKQVRKPGGIWYTSCTGIRQTVWLEPAPATRIQHLQITPDVDGKAVRVQVEVSGRAADATLEAQVLDGQKVVARSAVPLDGSATLVLPLAAPKLWAGGNPFLYGLRLSIRNGGRALDSIESYFASGRSR